MALPFARPSSPSSPSRSKTLPAGRRLGLRAEVGRLPLDRVRRRRQRPPAVAQRQAADPLLPRAEVPRGALRPRRRDRAVRRPGPPGLRRARASASTPPSRASTCWPRRRRRASSPSTCWRSGDESLLELPQRERRDRLERLVEKPVDLTPASEDPSRGAALAAGRRRRGRQAPGRAVPAGRARRDGEDQARAHDRRGRARLAAGQGGGHARLAHRWRSTTPRATCARSGTRSGFTAKQKRELPAFLAPYETGERFSAEPSRWNAARELDGAVVRPELVVEVTFDHTSNERIRHGTKLLRWRDDKPPRQCTMDQLES